MLRKLSPASSLDPASDPGDAAESATQDAAAVWGLPDFVFLPSTERVGSGTRELGDCVVIVGEIGLIVQVKARTAPSGRPERERNWLLKNAATGLSQGFGTVRRLRRATANVTNLRGRTFEIQPDGHDWTVVVVLDHPNPPEDVTPKLDDTSVPATVLLRRDWEFLFEQLKSTHAVAQYFKRTAGEELELGLESMRYYELAQADAAAEPSTLPPELLAGGGQPMSTPVLPLAPVATEARAAHLLVRSIFEDIALTPLTSASEEDRLRLLSELDRLPVGERGQIGSFVRDAMAQVAKAKDGETMWNMRSIRGPAGHAHLGFGACSRPYDEMTKDLFGWWVQLRHHDLLAMTNDVDGLTTVAILKTPRPRGGWDTTVSAFSGDPKFSASDLAQLRELFPGPTSL